MFAGDIIERAKTKFQTLIALVINGDGWDCSDSGWRWRIAREEILGNVIQLIRLVIEQYNAWTGKFIDKERLFHYPLPEELWSRLDTFLANLAALPCWIDKGLSTTVFGAKRNRDFWRTVFQTGKTPEGVRVLTKALDVNEMITGSQPFENKRVLL